MQLLSIELCSVEEEAELAPPTPSWSSCCRLVAPDDVMEVGDTEPSRVDELKSSPAIYKKINRKIVMGSEKRMIIAES